MGNRNCSPVKTLLSVIIVLKRFKYCFLEMAQDLLATNIDGLFERMNLEETQQVLRKMRLEVERKREELRVTVG